MEVKVVPSNHQLANSSLEIQMEVKIVPTNYQLANSSLEMFVKVSRSL